MSSNGGLVVKSLSFNDNDDLISVNPINSKDTLYASDSVEHLLSDKLTAAKYLEGGFQSGDGDIYVYSSLNHMIDIINIITTQPNIAEHYYTGQANILI